MIEFYCGQCGAKFTLKESEAGKIGRCKTCNSIVNIPSAGEFEVRDIARNLGSMHANTSSSDAAIMASLLQDEDCVGDKADKNQVAESKSSTDYLLCPWCAEPIKPLAKKCKHCGEFLRTINGGESHLQNSHIEERYDDMDVWIIGIPLVTSVVLVILGLFEGAEGGMTEVFLILNGISKISTSILITHEASESLKRRLGSNKEDFSSPGFWFFTVLFVFDIFYPWYMYDRKRMGLQNRLTIAIGVVVLNVLAFLVCIN